VQEFIKRPTSIGLTKDRRLEDLGAWLGTFPALNGFQLETASADASFRRYFRVGVGERTWIAMDAPPEREDSLPFVRVAACLESMGLNAPEVLAANLQQGFLLLSDLGDREYLETLETQPEAAASLYSDAMDALARMQSRGVAFEATLPPYDEALLRFEMSLFHDWLCAKHLSIRWTAAAESEWQRLCDLLVDEALLQPTVFVHRDYHSRNLMHTESGNPGILDFQDAVAGPLTYDLVSLLKDCYVSWPAETVSEWAAAYFERIDPTLQRQLGKERFFRDFALMGVQRHLKAAGIFARLWHRDGKAAYLPDAPRALAYIVALGDDYPELSFLVELIEQQVLPGLDAKA